MPSSLGIAPTQHDTAIPICQSWKGVLSLSTFIISQVHNSSVPLSSNTPGLNDLALQNLMTYQGCNSGVANGVYSQM